MGAMTFGEALRAVHKYDPSEARDNDGKWTDGGGSAGGGLPRLPHVAGDFNEPDSGLGLASDEDADWEAYAAAASAPHGTQEHDFNQSTPKQFIAARNKSTRAAFLSSHTADDLADHKLFMAPGGKVGYALDKDGDLQNLFNNGGPRGAGQKALIDAIHRGATTLDAFDPHLPALYSRYGFVPVGRMKFADEYAPAGWDYQRDGRPDVVFMAYRGGPRDSIQDRVGKFPEYQPSKAPLFDDYDSAKDAARRAVLDKGLAAGRSGGAGADHRGVWGGGFRDPLARPHGGHGGGEGPLSFGAALEAVQKLASPGSLYVHRPLLNAAQLHAWAAEAGIKNLVPPEEMHVTQVYSRTPVALAPRRDTVIAKRDLRRLGDKGAVVLHFDSPELAARHKEAMAAGASHDWPSYVAHVTLSYDAGDADLSKIDPPAFPLEFGPEVHSEINDNWAEDKGLR